MLTGVVAGVDRPASWPALRSAAHRALLQDREAGGKAELTEHDVDQRR